MIEVGNKCVTITDDGVFNVMEYRENLENLIYCGDVCGSTDNAINDYYVLVQALGFEENCHLFFVPNSDNEMEISNALTNLASVALRVGMREWDIIPTVKDKIYEKILKHEQQLDRKENID